jgi:hypothetical protein
MPSLSRMARELSADAISEDNPGADGYCDHENNASHDWGLLGGIRNHE